MPVGLEGPNFHRITANRGGFKPVSPGHLIEARGENTKSFWNQHNTCWKWIHNHNWGVFHRLPEGISPKIFANSKYVMRVSAYHVYHYKLTSL